MEQDPNKPELTDGEISYLYRLLAGILITDQRADYEYIDVRGIEQAPDKSSPVALTRQLPLEEVTKFMELDPDVETLTSAEIKYEEEHSIDNETDEPVAATVWVELYSQLQIAGQVIYKNESYVLKEPDPESNLSGSYTGVEYSDEQGMRIAFTQESFSDQGDLEEAMALLFEHMDLSQRNLNQSDQLKLQKLAKFLES